MKRPASGERNLERIQRWREACPEIVIRSTFIAGFPSETEEEFQHLLDFVREAQIDRAGCFCLQRRDGRRGQRTARHAALEVRESAVRASWPWPKKCRLPSCNAAWAPPCRCWWTMPRPWAQRVAWAARYADAPEIDGTVQLLPPEKISKQLKDGLQSKQTEHKKEPRGQCQWIKQRPFGVFVVLFSVQFDQN